MCFHFDAASFISGAKDLAIAGAAVTTAIVAYLGLQKWREELRGKADFDVARGLARATFKLRDEIQSCRVPLIRGAEYPPGYQTPLANQPKDLRVEAEALAYMYKNRWQGVSTALQEFDAQALEAEALWGADIRDSAQALRMCAMTLFVAIESIIDDRAAGGAHFEQDKEFGRRTSRPGSRVADRYGQSLIESNYRSRRCARNQTPGTPYAAKVRAASGQKPVLEHIGMPASKQPFTARGKLTRMTKPSTQGAHTEATRKKLREAEFFLHHLATVEKVMPTHYDPEAPPFFLSAFLSAARAIAWTLKSERTDEWNAWNHGWFTAMTDGEGKLWNFLVDERNKVHKQGGPELTYTVTPVSLMEFMSEMQGGSVSIYNMPGTPPPQFSKIQKTFTAVPGQSLAAACLPLFGMMRKLVEDFERGHPPT